MNSDNMACRKYSVEPSLWLAVNLKFDAPKRRSIYCLLWVSRASRQFENELQFSPSNAVEGTGVFIAVDHISKTQRHGLHMRKLARGNAPIVSIRSNLQVLHIFLCDSAAIAFKGASDLLTLDILLTAQSHLTLPPLPQAALAGRGDWQWKRPLLRRLSSTRL